mgnify:CR=1 FL=1
MKQGDIWMADLNPVKGSEKAGRRPVVILSGNLMNQYLPVVITAPLTSKIRHYQGNPVLLPNAMNGLKVESELMIFHIRSIAKDRLIEKLGEIEKQDLTMALETLNDLTTL